MKRAWKGVKVVIGGVCGLVGGVLILGALPLVLAAEWGLGFEYEGFLEGRACGWNKLGEGGRSATAATLKGVNTP